MNDSPTATLETAPPKRSRKAKIEPLWVLYNRKRLLFWRAVGGWTEYVNEARNFTEAEMKIFPCPVNCELVPKDEAKELLTESD